MLASGKAFFAGLGEHGKPGFVQVWKMPMQLMSEVSAHAAPIERMKLSYNNEHLFTAGRDCCLIVHEVKSRDPRTGALRQEGASRTQTYSDDILTEKQTLDEVYQHRDQLANELAAARDPSHSGVNEKASANDQDDKIKKLHEQLSSQQLMIRSKIE